MAHPAYAIALTHVMTQHITFSWRGHRSHTRHGRPTAYHFFHGTVRHMPSLAHTF